MHASRLRISILSWKKSPRRSGTRVYKDFSCLTIFLWSYMLSITRSSVNLASTWYRIGIAAPRRSPWMVTMRMNNSSVTCKINVVQSVPAVTALTTCSGRRRYFERASFWCWSGLWVTGHIWTILILIVLPDWFLGSGFKRTAVQWKTKKLWACSATQPKSVVFISFLRLFWEKYFISSNRLMHVHRNN